MPESLGSMCPILVLYFLFYIWDIILLFHFLATRRCFTTLREQGSQTKQFSPCLIFWCGSVCRCSLGTFWYSSFYTDFLSVIICAHFISILVSSFISSHFIFSHVSFLLKHPHFCLFQIWHPVTKSVLKRNCEQKHAHSSNLLSLNLQSINKLFFEHSVPVVPGTTAFTMKHGVKSCLISRNK